MHNVMLVVEWNTIVIVCSCGNLEIGLDEADTIHDLLQIGWDHVAIEKAKAVLN